MHRKHGKPGTGRLPKGLDILYEDDHLLVVNKPAGLLAVGTPTNRTRTVYYLLTEYVRKGNPKSRNRVFIVHRLDQWTSGVLVFAKSEPIKEHLQENWTGVKKTYIAVVHGRPKKDEGTITSYLAENKGLKVYSTRDPAKGKLSHTAYKLVKQTQQFSLLEIDLLTGRKNQIRVHLADIGCPIVGDRKYGWPDDGYRRLALHARSIRFDHPQTGKPLVCEARPPSYFRLLMESCPAAEEKSIPRGKSTASAVEVQTQKKSANRPK
jgi:RluA family pseudouridine synthase